MSFKSRVPAMEHSLSLYKSQFIVEDLFVFYLIYMCKKKKNPQSSYLFSMISFNIILFTLYFHKCLVHSKLQYSCIHYTVISEPRKCRLKLHCLTVFNIQSTTDPNSPHCSNNTSVSNSFTYMEDYDCKEIFFIHGGLDYDDNVL